MHMAEDSQRGFLLYVGAIAFLMVAAFLPCVTWGWLDGSTTEHGFGAFFLSLMFFVLCPIAALANIAILVSPFFFFAGRGRWIKYILLGCAVVELVTGVGSGRHIGFYVWIASLLLMAAAFHRMPGKREDEKDPQQCHPGDTTGPRL